MRLDSKVCIITGAGSGLGRDSALLFASEGATVVVADISTDRADETVAMVEKAGHAAISARCDVTVEGDVADLVDNAVEQFGRLDVMMANAGIVSQTMQTPFEEITEEVWRKTIDTNLTGTFFSAKHAVRVMKPQRKGSIVVTSSLAAFVAWPSVSPYVASKGGVNALVRAIALDAGGYGIRANAICPSQGMSPNFLLPIDAPVVGASYQEAADAPWDPSNSPMPLKLPRPPGLRDNANVALFLASDESEYMSGVSLPTCDGGQLARVASFLTPTGT